MSHLHCIRNLQRGLSMQGRFFRKHGCKRLSFEDEKLETIFLQLQHARHFNIMKKKAHSMQSSNEQHTRLLVDIHLEGYP
jgi:hypothetical protein